MAKVLGIGGIFFKSKNPTKLGNWYQTYLGIKIDDSYGGSSFEHEKSPPGAYSVWAPFADDTDYFKPSKNNFMINYIVDDIESALKQVKKGGATLHGEIEQDTYGRFGWFSDPEGNKVELWQPIDKHYVGRPPF